MVDTLYADPQELRAYLSIKDDIDDNLLALAVETASRWIDEECQRRFYLDDTATARYYFPPAGSDLIVDDFDPAVAPIVATGTTGTYGTAYTANTDYYLPPIQPGRPQNQLRRINNLWPVSTRGFATVSVTAKWGWPAVPAPIKNATLVLATDYFSMKDVPFGVAGFGDTGIRLRGNLAVEQMILPYKNRQLVL